MNKPPRLPWRRTTPDKPNDYRADLPIDRIAWARMFLATSGEKRWVWSASVGSFNDNGRCLGKQECADEATNAVWQLKRRDDLARNLPSSEPFEVDLDGPAEALEDYRFIIDFWWGERLMNGTAPPQIAELRTTLTRALHKLKAP